MTSNANLETASPLQIPGLENMTAAQLDYELGRGGRFVHFQYCISFIYVTLLRNSKVYFFRFEERTLARSLGYTLLTLVAGWWGFLWGPIYTVKAVWNNARGGDPADPALVNFVRSQLP